MHHMCGTQVRTANAATIEQQVYAGKVNYATRAASLLIGQLPGNTAASATHSALYPTDPHILVYHT